MINTAADILEKVRSRSPLIQAITNYVTVNDCANILLSFGASPAMVEAADEACGFARISGAVYINVGTLTPEQEQAAYQAMQGAKEENRPVVLDPVGCGAIPRKLEVIGNLARIGKFAIIKGNIGEIMALAGMEAQVKGVDFTGEASGIEEAAKLVAKKYGCTVAATGEVDVITDGERIYYVRNGVTMLTRITGAGCMLGALCAATAAVTNDMTAAAIAAVMAMGIAGEKAFERAELPGSFRVALIDSIYLLDKNMLLERGKLEC